MDETDLLSIGQTTADPSLWDSFTSGVGDFVSNGSDGAQGWSLNDVLNSVDTAQKIVTSVDKVVNSANNTYQKITGKSFLPKGAPTAKDTPAGAGGGTNGGTAPSTPASGTGSGALILVGAVVLLLVLA